MRKKIVFLTIAGLAIFGIWLIFFSPLFIFRSFSPDLTEEFTLTPDSLRKVTLDYKMGTVISKDISSITIYHLENKTTLVMQPAERIAEQKSNKTYNYSATEDEYNAFVNRLNYMLSHMEPIPIWRSAAHSPVWELNMDLINQKKINMVNSGYIWIDGKPWKVELPQEKDPVRYLTELGYEVIKEGQ